jgi:hypothetical protein
MGPESGHLDGDGECRCTRAGRRVWSLWGPQVADGGRAAWIRHRNIKGEIVSVGKLKKKKKK